jgi:hypothetical protein
MKTKMNNKNLLVSFLTIVSVLLLVSTVSANEITTHYDVKVKGINTYTNDISVIAGETITLKVYFTADEDDSDVTLEAEIEGEKVDFDAISEPFDVEDGSTYRKVLNLKIPYELKDEVNGEVTLNIELDGKEHKTELEEITLKVQRPSYNTDFKSITVSNSVEAGETFPVDIVLKNNGYNDLEDVYVTVSIPALDLEKTSYFGDLVAIECDEDDVDTASGRLYLKVPYDVEPGVYTLEVKAVNDDLATSKVKEITVKNDLLENVIKSGNDLIILNPTDRVKVYKIIAESPASVDESVIVVPAGSSRTVTVSSNAEEYDFNVNVFSGEELISTINFSGNAEETITNPVIILTAVLGIIFIVLLVVLIVLVTKKPEKSEEFGESYY